MYITYRNKTYVVTELEYVNNSSFTKIEPYKSKGENVSCKRT